MRLTLKQGLALAFVAFSCATLLGTWAGDTSLRALTAEESQLVVGGTLGCLYNYDDSATVCNTGCTGTGTAKVDSETQLKGLLPNKDVDCKPMSDCGTYRTTDTFCA
jgi:hypothetical protein